MMRADFAANFGAGLARDAGKGVIAENPVFRTGRIPDTWGFLVRSALVFGRKSPTDWKAGAVRPSSKVSRPSCPLPPHRHPEQSRETVCSQILSEANASQPRPTAGLSTTGRDSQASPFPPLKMTREKVQLIDHQPQSKHSVWPRAKLRGRQACPWRAPSIGQA
jgi:hypothetical protein